MERKHRICAAVSAAMLAAMAADGTIHAGTISSGDGRGLHGSGVRNFDWTRPRPEETASNPERSLAQRPYLKDVRPWTSQVQFRIQAPPANWDAKPDDKPGQVSASRWTRPTPQEIVANPSSGVGARPYLRSVGPGVALTQGNVRDYEGSAYTDTKRRTSAVAGGGKNAGKNSDGEKEKDKLGGESAGYPKEDKPEDSDKGSNKGVVDGDRAGKEGKKTSLDGDESDDLDSGAVVAGLNIKEYLAGSKVASRDASGTLSGNLVSLFNTSSARPPAPAAVVKPTSTNSAAAPVSKNSPALSGDAPQPSWWDRTTGALGNLWTSLWGSGRTAAKNPAAPTASHKENVDAQGKSGLSQFGPSIRGDIR